MKKNIGEIDDDSLGDDNKNHDGGTQNDDDYLGNETYNGVVTLKEIFSPSHQI